MKETILIQVDTKKTGFELYFKLKKDMEDKQINIVSENKKKLELQTKYCTVKIRPNDPHVSYLGYRYDVIYGFNNSDIKYSEKISDYIKNVEVTRSTIIGKLFNETTLKIYVIIFFIILLIIPYVMLGIGDHYSKKSPNVEPTTTKTVQLSTPIDTNETTSFLTEESKTNNYFDIPLDNKLQDHIFNLCDKYNVEPSIVIGIIERESNYDTSAVGDNGESFGLMQIQPRWHQERMKKLNCDDLLDPYQNVAVGIDYLADLYSTGKQTEWVLMAYNGGRSYANDSINEGIISEYAETVLMNSKRLKMETSNT